jgi:hypothetical protein
MLTLIACGYRMRYRRHSRPVTRPTLRAVALVAAFYLLIRPQVSVAEDFPKRHRDDGGRRF